MAKKALILNGEVVQVESQNFPVAAPLQWADCPDDVLRGHTYDGEKFTAPPAPEIIAPPVSELEVLKAALKQKGILTDAELTAARAAEKAK